MRPRRRSGLREPDHWRANPRIQSGKREDGCVGERCDAGGGIKRGGRVPRRTLRRNGSGVELECRAQRAIQAYVRFRPGGRVHPPALIRLGPVALTLEAAEIRGGCDLALFSVHGVVFGKIPVRPS